MRTFVQIAAIALFVAATAFNIAAVAADPGWLIVPAVVAGWFFADMASGLVHMYMDYRPCPEGKGLAALYFYQGSRASEGYRTRFAEAMRGLSPVERLAYDFKNHHPRPDALGRRDMWRQIGSTLLLGTLPGALILALAVVFTDIPGWLTAGFISLQIGSTFAQYFHGSLHRDDNPPPVRALRRIGLLMSPAAHRKHHATLDRDFATNCGWSNAFLNPVFRWALRRGLLTTQGLEPPA